MKAAIYARKSTDDDRTEENKSVTRQADNARAYAESGRGVIRKACLLSRVKSCWP